MRVLFVLRTHAGEDACVPVASAIRHGKTEHTEPKPIEPPPTNSPADLLRVSGSSQKPGGKIDEQHRECCDRGDKTELAERADDESLEIEKPDREDRHQYYLDAEQHPRHPITERGEQRETERNEIRRRSKRCERDVAYRGVRTCENGFASDNDAARNGLRGEMVNSEIRRVGKSDQCDDSTGDGKLRYRNPGRRFI